MMCFGYFSRHSFVILVAAFATAGKNYNIPVSIYTKSANNGSSRRHILRHFS